MQLMSALIASGSADNGWVPSLTRHFGLLARLIAGLLIFASASAAHAQYARWQFPQQYALTPKGVNLTTGRFHYSRTDLSIGNVSFTRNWGDMPAITVANRSMGELKLFSETPVISWAPNSLGWSNNFNQGVHYWPGNANSFARYYVVADGRLFNFLVLSDGSIVPADQAASGTMLTSVNGQWNFTDRSGTAYVYFAHPAMPQDGVAGNPNQLIQSVTYANGARLDFTYTPNGQPRFVRSNSGYAIGIEYDASGNVAAACGFNLAAAYADAATPCSSSGVKVGYGYDPSGKNLTSITGTLGQVTSVSYSNFQSIYYFPTCITLPSSSTCEISNVFGPLPSDTVPTAELDQVRTQTTATGDTWSYTYRGQPDPADVPIVIGLPRYSTSRMTDPLGGIYFLRFDRGHLIEQSTPEGTIKFRYKYALVSSGTYSNYAITANPVQYFDDAPGLQILPEGNMEYFGHDSRSNVTMRASWPKGSANPLLPSNTNWQGCCLSLGTPLSPSGSVSATQTFLADFGVISVNGFVFVLGCGSGPADAKLCDKPLSRIDANGGQTDFTYAQAHGGVLTETGPAVNGIRPQTRYAYTLRFAWIRAANGSYVQASQPQWVLTQKSSCKTGAAAASGTGCAIAGDEVITTYDYGPDSGPNNLLLRGKVEDVGGAALRTCITYDQFGNKISETRPLGTSGTCP
jgi:hypothetical protein